MTSNYIETNTRNLINRTDCEFNRLKCIAKHSNKLKGPTGPQGAAGPRGNKGATGATGPTGSQPIFKQINIAYAGYISSTAGDLNTGSENGQVNLVLDEQSVYIWFDPTWDLINPQPTPPYYFYDLDQCGLYEVNMTVTELICPVNSFAIDKYGCKFYIMTTNGWKPYCIEVEDLDLLGPSLINPNIKNSIIYHLSSELYDPISIIEKRLISGSDSGPISVTAISNIVDPSDGSNKSTISFSDKGAYINLLFNGTEWNVLSNENVTLS